jgi:hypothetical protein
MESQLLLGMLLLVMGLEDLALLPTFLLQIKQEEREQKAW